jgi:hypothetical protein
MEGLFRARMMASSLYPYSKLCLNKLGLHPIPPRTFGWSAMDAVDFGPGIPPFRLDLTLWHHFLMKILNARYSAFQLFNPEPVVHGNFFFEVQQRFDGRLLQLFLRFKEDIEFSFEIRVDETTPPLRQDFLLPSGGNGLMIKLRTKDIPQGTQDGYSLLWGKKV